jgi:hypothetical protein
MSDAVFIKESLQERLERPRLIFWLGPGFELDADLRQDLSGLQANLLSSYVETTEDEFETALRGSAAAPRRQISAVTDAQEVDAWEPADLAIFYLNGRRGEALARPLRQVRRARMLDTLRVQLNERPVIIALGFDGWRNEMIEMLATLAAYDPNVPTILLGDSAANRTAVDGASEVEGPFGCIGLGWPSWGALRQELESDGYRLLAVEEPPQILVGRQRVSLGKLLSDPTLRIDAQWRVITTKAAGEAPPDVKREVLFHRFMAPDERRDASQIHEDLSEWWAHSAGIPFPREPQTIATRIVLEELEGLGAEAHKGGAPPLKICWLPAEPGSGATVVLHGIALAAARQGYPVLILKQMARGVDAQQIGEFLQGVHDLATAQSGEELGTSPEDGQNRKERPALLILDCQHAGDETVEALPDYLVRKKNRRLLTLWAVRVPPLRAAEVRDASRPHDAGSLFVGLKDLVPRASDRVLPMVHARIAPREVQLLQQHVSSLSDPTLPEWKRVPLPERTQDTWAAFQQGQGFNAESFLQASDMTAPEIEDVRTELSAENLFWVLLYHFLTVPEADPIGVATARWIEPILGPPAGIASPEDRLAIGMLLEIAKTSNWGLLLPQTALVDWCRAQQKGGGAPADTNDGEPPGPPEDIDWEVTRKRLAEWTNSTPLSHRHKGVDPEAEVRRLLHRHELAGQVRLHLIGSTTLVRLPHRVIARQLLLQALAQRDVLERELPGAIVGHRAILYEDCAFSGLSNLLTVLTSVGPNIQFCAQLSELLLVGDDRWAGWRDGRGEDRLRVYAAMPASIRDRSRVLEHHFALVLRRTTFWRDMADSTRRERLLQARDHLERALAMTWRYGARDEHPSHIRTSLGLVLNSLSHVSPADTVSLRAQARAVLSEALVDLPDSRHTRMTLAQILIDQAEEARAREDAAKAGAVGDVAEALWLLSVEPTGREVTWFELKHRAAGMFSDAAGDAFLMDLQRQGKEEGFLLEAELEHARGNASRAIEVLSPLVRGDSVARHPRSARRVAELMASSPETRTEYAERYRLLAVAEHSAFRLTPAEEYQLAWLAFQLGFYDEGGRRFVRLRASNRSFDVLGEQWPYLVDENTGAPREFEGQVLSTDGGRGWMAVIERGHVLFRVPFVVHHFALGTRALRPGRSETILIRFSGLGPRAVPVRFAFADGRREVR